jgi:hypothetical protein
VIQDVEDICSKLTADPFGERQPFEDRAVNVPVTRTVDRAVTRQLTKRRVGHAVCAGNVAAGVENTEVSKYN